MRRTSPADLLAPFLVLAAAVYVLVRAYYDSLPPLNYAVGVPIAGLAVGELVAARRVRAAVTHDPDAKAMAAIVIARCVALGKASALVAAALAGAMTGLLVRVIPDAGRVSAAESDTRAGIIILLASLLLLVSGLLLERAGIVPRGPTSVQSQM
jgi:hypothetical protein